MASRGVRAEGPRGNAWGRRAREAGAGPGDVSAMVRQLKADAYDPAPSSVGDTEDASPTYDAPSPTAPAEPAEPTGEVRDAVTAPEAEPVAEPTEPTLPAGESAPAPSSPVTAPTTLDFSSYMLPDPKTDILPGFDAVA